MNPVLEGTLSRGGVFVAAALGLLVLACGLLLHWLRRAREECRTMRRVVVTMQGHVLAGELAAAVAHDLNNALMVVGHYIEQARIATVSDSTEQVLAEAREKVQYACALAIQLAGIVGGKCAPSARRQDLANLINSVVHSLSQLGRIRSECVELVLAKEAVVEVDPVLFERIVTNLVLNAADAAGDVGRIRIVLVTEPEQLRLEVHDNGSGVPAGGMARLISAFASTKPRGLGLGLFSVKLAVELQGGSVSVGTSPLGGAVFVVIIPGVLCDHARPHRSA